MRLLELDPIQAEANRIRAAAGIGQEEVIPDIVAVLRRLGLVVALRHLAADGLDGIYGTAGGAGPGGPAGDLPGGTGWIVLNSAKFRHRLRCVGAHLLAHHVYGDEPHVDHDIESPEDDVVQQRANAFAARFLITREAIWDRRPSQGPVTPADSVGLACGFGVEHRIVLQRLQELGMADE